MICEKCGGDGTDSPCWMCIEEALAGEPLWDKDGDPLPEGINRKYTNYPCGCKAAPAEEVPIYCPDHGLQEVEYRITKTGKVLVAHGNPITRKLLEGVMPDDAKVEAINDRDFFAFCEGCGVAICDGDEHFNDPEGIYLCPDCHE